MPGPALDRLTDGRTRECRERRGPLGAYSRAIASARGIDGRTTAGKLISATRRALADHLGGEDRLSAPQRALIERCAMLQLRIAALDARIVDGSFTEYDAKTYLAFHNSLTRTLLGLGLQAAAEPLDPVQRLPRIESRIVEPWNDGTVEAKASDDPTLGTTGDRPESVSSPSD
jgi:hypothetical protein